MASADPISAIDTSAFQNRAARITGLHDHCTVAWHQEPPAAPLFAGELERILAEQHLANFELWHIEDSARAPDARDSDLARIKHLIDSTNQRRNDLIEHCDRLLLAWLAERNLPVPEAELHSETPGLMIDRLSILALKLFHTHEEICRPGAPPGHAELNQKRLLILTEQRADLADALDRLWHQVLAGQRRFKLYQQLKMYNDPALNPSVYASRSVT